MSKLTAEAGATIYNLQSQRDKMKVVNLARRTENKHRATKALQEAIVNTLKGFGLTPEVAPGIEVFLKMAGDIVDQCHGEDDTTMNHIQFAIQLCKDLQDEEQAELNERMI